MTVKIYDDFWEAAQMLPEKQRPAFIYAICAYAMEQVEPKGNPPWLPVFTVIRDRISLSREASARGRKAANARWHADASQNQDANALDYAYADANADAYADASENSDAEIEIEIEGLDTPYSPPYADSDANEHGTFWIQCLNALNEIMVTPYTTMPDKCRCMLEKSKGTYTVDQVRDMIAYKRDNWQGTRYSKCLTPQTLFSPDHFEQYMHESLDEKEASDDFSIYDQH